MAPSRTQQTLRDTMTELLSTDEPRMRIAAMLSGLDIHYYLGNGHPLLGRRMPDLDLHYRTWHGHCARCHLDSARRTFSRQFEEALFG